MGRTIWTRAEDIALIVLKDYDIDDAADMALEEIHRDPSQDDQEIANKVAHAIGQP